MMKINFPEHYKHQHPPIRNVNEILKERITLGEKSADFVANLVGSWKFLIVQSIFITLWIILNIVAFVNHWDPYPFILMNLFLSLQAAYTAPVIMMSQNRQADRDRIEAHNDYIINQKSEEEIRIVLEHLEAQNESIKEIYSILEKISINGNINDKNI